MLRWLLKSSEGLQVSSMQGARLPGSGRIKIRQYIKLARLIVAMGLFLTRGQKRLSIKAVCLRGPEDLHLI